MNISKRQRRLLIAGCLSALLVFLAGLSILKYAGRRRELSGIDSDSLSLRRPARTEPGRFHPNTHMPPTGEGLASGSIDLESFSSDRDLTHIDDPRVWWESDHDEGDNEDDHMIHKSLEIPLRRLIELVCRNGGVLEVHDAYRAEGIHNPRSLHKEGRAVDLTCDDFSLEQLAKFCWVAGFDWVYYEATDRNGAHIHCSVKRERNYE